MKREIVLGLALIFISLGVLLFLQFNIMFSFMGQVISEEEEVPNIWVSIAVFTALGIFIFIIHKFVNKGRKK